MRMKYVGLGFNIDDWCEINYRSDDQRSGLENKQILWGSYRKTRNKENGYHSESPSEDGSEHMNSYVNDMGNMASILEKQAWKPF